MALENFFFILMFTVTSLLFSQNPLDNYLIGNNNLTVINDTLRRSLKSQMKDANRLQALYTIIIGEDEIKNNKVTIKSMDKGTQDYVSFDKINSYFLKK